MVQEGHYQSGLPVVCQDYIRLKRECRAKSGDAVGEKNIPLRVVKIFPLVSPVDSISVKKFIPPHQVYGHIAIQLTKQYIPCDIPLPQCYR